MNNSTILLVYIQYALIFLIKKKIYRNFLTQRFYVQNQHSSLNDILNSDKTDNLNYHFRIKMNKEKKKQIKFSSFYDTRQNFIALI